MRVAQPGAQDPILQEPASSPLIHLAIIKLHPLPNQNLRHFFHNLAVLDYLGIVAGDADDPLNLSVHLNGQVDSPPHIGQLRLQLRRDVILRQPVLNDPVRPGVERPDPGRVIAGDDVSRIVHQIDILSDQLANLLHNLLGTVAGYPHFHPSGVSFFVIVSPSRKIRKYTGQHALRLL